MEPIENISAFFLKKTFFRNIFLEWLVKSITLRHEYLIKFKYHNLKQISYKCHTVELGRFNVKVQQITDHEQVWRRKMGNDKQQNRKSLK